MADFKGMLGVRWDNGKHRLSAGQRDLVGQAVVAALADYSAESVDVKALAGRVVGEALACWPVDRSCLTCSYEGRGHCSFHGEKVPDSKALEAGCDEWQDDGVPF